MRTTSAIFALLMLGTAAAAAQELPCSQIRIIVPYPAGGATDVATRVVAERLDKAMKKPFVVENRGGAAGNIGTLQAINSTPDGCTLLVTQLSSRPSRTRSPSSPTIRSRTCSRSVVSASRRR